MDHEGRRPRAAAATAPRSVTSATTGSAPAASIARRRLGGRRRSRARSAPSAARAAVTARPMKPPAPVTAAATPSKRASSGMRATLARLLYSPRLAPAHRSPPTPGPGRRLARAAWPPGAASPPRSSCHSCVAGWRIPAAGDHRRRRRRPDGAGGAAPAHAEARRGPVRAADVGRSRSPTSCPTTIPRRCDGACASAIRSAATACSAAASCRPPACSGRSRGPGEATALDRVLTVAHWAWFFAAARLARSTCSLATRALPARGPPARRHLRPRLRDLLPGARRRRRGGRPRRATSTRSWSACAPRSPAGPAAAAAADHGRRRRAGLGDGRGRGSTTRSAATRGRRCRRFTSRPR